MRTRIFNKMTAGEIEEYLARGGDTIFLPVGVVEIHGELPVDCETILAEGYSVAMAEKCDGLVLADLPYFYPGGTVVGNATVHLSIYDGIAYLHKIAKSLVGQGFKKIFLVTGHAPASLTVDAFCRDFFEATLIHPCHIELMRFMGRTMGEKAAFDLSVFDKTICGAYKIVGQENCLPVRPDAVASVGERLPNPPEMENLISRLRPIGGPVALVFSDLKQHGGGNVFRSVEERDAVCAEGEALIRKAVDSYDMEGLAKAVGDYQAYVQRVADQFPRLRTLG